MILTTDIIVLPVNADSVLSAITLQPITLIQTSNFFLLENNPISNFLCQRIKNDLFFFKIEVFRDFCVSFGNMGWVFSITIVRTSNA